MKLGFKGTQLSKAKRLEINLFKRSFVKKTIHHGLVNGTKCSRMDQVKFVEDSL